MKKMISLALLMLTSVALAAPSPVPTSTPPITITNSELDSMQWPQGDLQKEAQAAEVDEESQVPAASTQLVLDEETAKQSDDLVDGNTEMAPEEVNSEWQGHEDANWVEQ
jgi:hypothetical protein